MRQIWIFSKCFLINKKSMFAPTKLYQGCHYPGINRHNICTRGIPVLKQSQKCFGQKRLRALWRGGKIPGGLHNTGLSFQMRKSGSEMHLQWWSWFWLFFCCFCFLSHNFHTGDVGGGNCDRNSVLRVMWGCWWCMYWRFWIRRCDVLNWWVGGT